MVIILTCCTKCSSVFGSTMVVFMCARNDPNPSNIPAYFNGTGNVTYTKKFNNIAQLKESLRCGRTLMKVVRWAVSNVPEDIARRAGVKGYSCGVYGLYFRMVEKGKTILIYNNNVSVRVCVYLSMTYVLDLGACSFLVAEIIACVWFI